MKNMVAFAPYFSIFRHDEWGGTVTAPPPLKTLRG